MQSPRVTIVDHPLAAVTLTALRRSSTPRPAFRSALEDLSGLLVYEATRGLPLAEESIRTPVAEATGHRLARVPHLVPVLRAGFGMLAAASRLLPDAPVGFVGLARDERTLQPRAYLEALPDSLAVESVFLLDPMLATGGSVLRAVELLVERHVADVTVVCVLAAPEGLEALAAASCPLSVVTASVDERLDERAFIVPGLGDAGDRQFDA